MQPVLNNGFNINNPSTWQQSAKLSYLPIQTPIANTDSFEKEKSDKKKRTAIISAVIITAIATTVAIIKRKQISEFFSTLFKKKGGAEPPQPPPDNISPKKPSVIPNGPTREVSPKTPEIPLIKPTTSEIIFPKPKFSANPTAQEKQAYVDSIMGYTNHTDKELVKKSLDAIEKYGTWEDIDKIGFVRMTDDESLIVPLVRAVAKVGRVREDDYFFIQYITAREHNLSNQTYAIVLEAISKLSNNVGKEYEDMVRLVNKIPADTDGKFTTTLISTLTKLGKEEDIEYLNKYLRNYNRVNDFINKGQKTPESVKDAVAKIVEGIKRKTS